MPRAAIRGLLFDKDGTLFDFNATWAAVIERLLETLAPDPALRERMARIAGYDPLTREFLPGAPIVAGSTAEIAEIWAGMAPGRSAAEIERLANEIAGGVSGGELVPACRDLPGFLDRLREAGFKLGVATHDAEGAARAHLAAAGALDRFDFVAGYDSGHGLKPGPGMLWAFAAATGLSPENVAVLGDSRHDLEMVPAAGAALAIGVLTGPAKEEDLAPYADHVIASIAALPELLARYPS